MTARSTLCSLLIAVAMLFVGSLAAPADAANNKDFGSETVQKSLARHASCAKAASALIAASKKDANLRAFAFKRITRVRTIAQSVTTTDTLPSGSGTFTVTDVVRCSGKASRQGTHGMVPTWFSVTYAPDFVDTPLSTLVKLTHPPASTYSVNYQTAVRPAW